MDKTKVALKELKKLLQAGYSLQEEKNAFRVHRVPRSWENDFNEKSFDDYLKFGASGQIDYKTYTESIKDTFNGFNLNFTKFTSRTDTINPKVDLDSPAGLLTRQLRELENITTEINVLESYVIPETYEKIEFIDEVVSQGFKKHRFIGDEHRKLVQILWDRRRIVNSKSKVLEEEKPTTKEEIYKELNVDHERFKDIVRAIKIEMKRKNISLDIRFPKNVVLIVKQDPV